MKKTFLVLCLLAFLFSMGLAQAIDREIPSAMKTSSAAIIASPGYFNGITVITDGTNAVTVDIYDNATAASGTKLIPTWLVTSSATDRSQTYNLFPPVQVFKGIYVNISVAGGGSASYMVYYSH